MENFKMDIQFLCQPGGGDKLHHAVGHPGSVRLGRLHRHPAGLFDFLSVVHV
jgi:hypothetical protein